MYSEIASNKRRTVTVVFSFLAIWLAIGVAAGLLFKPQADRDLVFWKTSNRIFRLGLADTDPASTLVTARP
jgi:hypothetical protein